MSKLYEYAVVLEERCDGDGNVTEAAEIVVPPTTILARDEVQAQMLAARAIPQEFVENGKFDRLTVAVRGF